MRLRAAVLGLTVVLAAACGSTPSSSASSDGPIGRSVREAPFALELVVGKARYAPDQPIEAQATLHFLGPEGRIEISGSGDGPIFFRLEEVDGPRDMGPAWSDDCASHTIAGTVTRPFIKGGGWSADDPNAAFYRAFFADPLFRLPAGRWRISAIADFYAMPGRPDLRCGDAQHWTIEAGVEIEVAP